MYRFFASVYAHPHNFVRFEVPLFKYSTLDILDVINLVHPDLPAFHGTSSNAKNPTYGTDDVPVNVGNYWKRAKSYRAIIEGKQIDMDRDDFPTLLVTARILNNYPKDPT